MKFLFNNFLLGNIQRNSTPFFFLQNWVQIFFRMLKCHLAYFIKIKILSIFFLFGTKWRRLLLVQNVHRNLPEHANDEVR